MTEDGIRGVERATEDRLPRRDWIVLPCLFFGTAILLAGGAELVARLAFRRSQEGVERCVVLNDATTGPRGIPNSVCTQEYPETERIEYRFNSCGHRAGMECGPKAAGVYRIVMTGSSAAMGMRVEQRQSFAALLPEALSEKTGRRVELYNASIGAKFSHRAALGFNEVLAARPDLILWILMPADVAGSSPVQAKPEEIGERKSKSLAERMSLRAKQIVGSDSGMNALADLYMRSRTALLLEHFLYQSESLYVPAALAGKESDVGFLRDPMGALWNERLRQVDSDAATMEGQARDAGIPFVAAYVPTRAQAAMVSMRHWPTGFDPYKLDDRLRAIIESHGGKYVDTLPEFWAIPNAGRFYFPMDGHPNAEGHAELARLLAKQLGSGVVPALRVDEQRNAGGGR